MILFDVGNGLFFGLEILAPTVAGHIIPRGPCANFILIVATAADKQRIAMAVLVVMGEDHVNNLPRFFSSV